MAFSQTILALDTHDFVRLIHVASNGRLPHTRLNHSNASSTTISAIGPDRHVVEAAGELLGETDLYEVGLYALDCAEEGNSDAARVFCQDLKNFFQHYESLKRFERMYGLQGNEIDLVTAYHWNYALLTQGTRGEASIVDCIHHVTDIDPIRRWRVLSPETRAEVKKCWDTLIIPMKPRLPAWIDRIRELVLQNECLSCHEDYTTPCSLTCGHVFCADCALVWVYRHRECPACRTPMDFKAGEFELLATRPNLDFTCPATIKVGYSSTDVTLDWNHTQGRFSIVPAAGHSSPLKNVSMYHQITAFTLLEPDVARMKIKGKPQFQLHLREDDRRIHALIMQSSISVVVRVLVEARKVEGAEEQAAVISQYIEDEQQGE